MGLVLPAWLDPATLRWAAHEEEQRSLQHSDQGSAVAVAHRTFARRLRRWADQVEKKRARAQGGGE